MGNNLITLLQAQFFYGMFDTIEKEIGWDSNHYVPLADPVQNIMPLSELYSALKEEVNGK